MAEVEVPQNEASENKENEGEGEEDMMEAEDLSDHSAGEENTANDVVVKKKGRGRPPKDGQSPKIKDASSVKKGRGRPKEDDSPGKTPKKKTPKKEKIKKTPTRTLERPRKIASYKEDDNSANDMDSDDEETVKKGRGRPKASSGSKGRGRPRKSGSGPSTSGTSHKKGARKSIASDEWNSDYDDDDHVGRKAVKRIGRVKDQVKYTEESDMETSEDDYVQYTQGAGRPKIGEKSKSRMANGNAKKGRGRPKKSETDSAPKTQKVEAYSDISDSGEGWSDESSYTPGDQSDGSVYNPGAADKPHKVDAKGRGRPPSTGQGRGRPSHKAKKGQSKASSSPKKGRGRPKKSVEDEEAGDQSDDEEVKPKKGRGRPPSTPKPGRGRPKKTQDSGSNDKAGQKRPLAESDQEDGSDDEDIAEDAPKTQKGRGRPKKAKTVEPEEEDQEEEEEEDAPVLLPEISTGKSEKQENAQLEDENDEGDSEGNEDS